MSFSALSLPPWSMETGRVCSVCALCTEERVHLTLPAPVHTLAFVSTQRAVEAPVRALVVYPLEGEGQRLHLAAAETQPRGTDASLRGQAEDGTSAHPEEEALFWDYITGITVIRSRWAPVVTD